MSVDQEFARWLREGALYATAPDAAVAALWGTLARSTEIMTPLALAAGAVAEGARQIAFLGGALVIDSAVVPGLRSDLIGQPITLKGSGLGYEAGVAVFTLSAAEAAATEETTLTVLRKLT